MNQSGTSDPFPYWWVAPDSTDLLSFGGLLALVFFLYLVIFLYARFEKYAELKGSLTPLRTTIPTMLTVGLAYDLLPPLENVSILVPLALLAAAFSRDIFLWTSEGSKQRD